MLEIKKGNDFQENKERIKEAIEKEERFKINPSLIGRLAFLHPHDRCQSCFFYPLQFLVQSTISKESVQIKIDSKHLKAEVLMPIIEKTCQFKWKGNEDVYGKIIMEGPGPNPLQRTVEVKTVNILANYYNNLRDERLEF